MTTRRLLPTLVILATLFFAWCLPGTNANEIPAVSIVTEHAPYTLLLQLNALLSYVPLATSLLALIGIDIAMGILAVFVAKRVSSATSFRGVTKKAACVLIVSCAAVIEPFAQGIPLAKLVSLFYIFTESISILEAAAALGVPLPPQLVETLVKLRANEKIPTLPAVPAVPVVMPPPVTINTRGPVSVRGAGAITQRIAVPSTEAATAPSTDQTPSQDG